MTRLTAVAAAALAVLGLATGALAKPGKAKKPGVYNARINSLVADSYAFPGVTGHAHLVDDKKNNQLSIHVQGLQPNTVYTWEFNSTTTTTTPCAKPASNPVSGWTPKKPQFKSNDAGVANGQARSKTFVAQQGTTYYVTVRLGDMFLACGVFKSVRKPHPPHPTTTKPNHPTSHKPTTKGHGS
jgi:hypothetical protein